MTTQDSFHGCPQCPKHKGPDNVYDAGRLHRGACHKHRTSWVIGANLLSSWRTTLEEADWDSDETLRRQRERYLEIEGYEDLDRLAERHGEAA